MRSSSLFLRSSTTFITFFVCLNLSLAVTTTSASYALQTTYAGSNFLSGFSFYTDADPTHGFVTYVNQSRAQSLGLITATDGSPVRIGVDYTNKYDGTKAYSGINGVGRPSVRITSNAAYNHGLFIADILNMPGGVCGTWPALWTLGTGSWPQSGEIDIIEGVHTQKQSLTSMHTSGKCNVPSYPSTETGTIQTTNCTYDSATGTNSAGCGVLDDDTTSFGLPFNSQNGGVFAWEWTSNSVRTWFWPRNSIPSDIKNGSPQPSGWKTPYVNFQGDCNIDANFKNHQIVLDNTFCGDWAGAVWGDSCAASTGVSSCSVYVGNNPSAFQNMYWSINSIKIYSNATSTTTTTTSTTTTTTTTTKTTTSSTTTNTSSSTTTTTSKSSTTTTTTSSASTTTSTSSRPSSTTTTTTATTTTTSSSITTTPSTSSSTSSSLTTFSSSKSSSTSTSFSSTASMTSSLSISSSSSLSTTLTTITSTTQGTNPASASTSFATSTTPSPLSSSSSSSLSLSSQVTTSSTNTPSTQTTVTDASSTTSTTSTTTRSIRKITLSSSTTLTMTTTTSTTTTTTTATSASVTSSVYPRKIGRDRILRHRHFHDIHNF